MLLSVLLQSLHHLVNCGKYFTTCLVIIFNLLNNYLHGIFLKVLFCLNNYILLFAIRICSAEVYMLLWVGFATFSTLYSFIWDVAMDWGLTIQCTRDIVFREQLKFPRSVNICLYWPYILIISAVIY